MANVNLDYLYTKWMDLRRTQTDHDNTVMVQTDKKAVDDVLLKITLYRKSL